MARKKKVKNPRPKDEDYGHQDAKRKNIPLAGLAACHHTSEVAK